MSREHRTGHRSGHSKRVTALSWNCTGFYLATGSADKEILIHKHGSEKEIISRTQPQRLHLKGHKGVITSIAFNTKDPDMLASASDTNEVYFWSCRSPKLPTHTFKLGSTAFFLTWSECGNLCCLLCQNDTMIILNKKDPKKGAIQKPMGFRLQEAKFANNDNVLIFTREHKLEFYSVKELSANSKEVKPLVTINCSCGILRTFDVDRRTSFIVTGASDGTASVWTTKNLTCTKSIQSSSNCALIKARVSCDSSMIALAGDDQEIVILPYPRIDSSIPIIQIDHRSSNLAMCWNPKFNILAYTCLPSSSRYDRDQQEVCRLWQASRK